MGHISLIAALGTHTRAIGRNNALLWHIPEDLARFKRLTMGHPIIMGRKTFDSIGRPLRGRTNIVITRNQSWTHEGVLVMHTLQDAINHAHTIDTKEVFVIGGSDIYTQALPHADRLYLTLVQDDTPGDVYFPPYTHLPFVGTEEEAHPTSSPPFTFITLERSDR